MSNSIKRDVSLHNVIGKPVKAQALRAEKSPAEPSWLVLARIGRASTSSSPSSGFFSSILRCFLILLVSTENVARPTSVGSYKIWPKYAHKHSKGKNWCIYYLKKWIRLCSLESLRNTSLPINFDHTAKRAGCARPYSRRSPDRAYTIYTFTAVMNNNVEISMSVPWSEIIYGASEVQ